MLDLEILILELFPIDRFPTCTVSHGKIATLDHKARVKVSLDRWHGEMGTPFDYAVEITPFV